MYTMKLIKLGVALVAVILTAIVALATVSHTGSTQITSNEGITIEGNVRTVKEEVCIDNSKDITCKEETYLEINGERYEIPIMTGFTIKEKVFVPEYVEKYKIVIEEKKLMGEERESPADRIKDSDVNAFSNSVRIDIKNAKWRNYIDSNSMDPLIDEGTTTIEINPKYPSDIKIGDIVAYDVDGYDYAFVHRVVDIGNDEEGVYFITKGDNFYKEDPDKLRFSDIEGIVVGILY